MSAGACGRSSRDSSAAPRDPVHAVTVSIDEARAVFTRRVDAWLAADLDAYMACWHDDMVIELPSGVIESVGRYRKLVSAGFEWAAPVSFDVHHLAVDGTVVFADWTITARR